MLGQRLEVELGMIMSAETNGRDDDDDDDDDELPPFFRHGHMLSVLCVAMELKHDAIATSNVSKD